MKTQSIELVVQQQDAYLLSSSKVRAAADAAQAFEAVFHPGREAREVSLALFLAADGTILGAAETGTGDQHRVVAAPVIVLQRAILLKAARVVVAHTHPGASLRPSKADWRSTMSLQHACRRLGVRVMDHLILRGQTYVSMNALARAHHADVTIPMADLARREAHVVPDVAGAGCRVTIPRVSVRVAHRPALRDDVPDTLPTPEATAAAFVRLFAPEAAERADERLCVFFLDHQKGVLGAGEIRDIARLSGRMLARIVCAAAILHGATGLAVAVRAGTRLAGDGADDHGFFHLLDLGYDLGLDACGCFLFGKDAASLQRLVAATKQRGARTAAERYEAVARPAAAGRTIP